MIGGNKMLQIQKRTASRKNSIGAAETVWEDAAELVGFLDLSGGDSRYTVYNAKVQESTHVFICDYKDLTGLDLTGENTRGIIDGKIYDISLIDDPMELHEHLEIFLRYVGGNPT